MDTAQKEKIAENAIASKLASRGLLIAKPFFDQRGADLLAFVHVCGGAKFCRVQSKFRQSEGTITIPVHYVPGAFVCIVNLVPRETAGNPEGIFLCFFKDAIETWNKRDGAYELSLPMYETCVKKFAGNMLDDSAHEKIRTLIIESTVQEEMGMLDFSNPNNSGLVVLLCHDI